MTVVMSSADWESFHDYVPWITDDTAAQVRIDALGSWPAAALAYTRRRLSQLLDAPSSFSVPEYSESWSANISALEKNVTALEAIVPTDEGGGSFTVGRVVRHGRGARSGYR